MTAFLTGIASVSLASGLIPSRYGQSVSGTFLMAPRGNTSRNEHLRFLGITSRTRRSYENAAAAFFQYFRTYRADCLLRCMSSTRSWRNTSITSTRRVIPYQWRGGPSVASSGPPLQTTPPHRAALPSKLATCSHAKKNKPHDVAGGKGHVGRCFSGQSA